MSKADDVLQELFDLASTDDFKVILSIKDLEFTAMLKVRGQRYTSIAFDNAEDALHDYQGRLHRPSSSIE